ncbi:MULTISPECIES: LacI family DNA-binding transcriptional regulator [unclassified Sphingomonas]|uniref:LacI family DNA-binding transcriptional regulator n=1 Tax=unclassified Sphingomonas TaxID=196159 RepID=UPI00070214EE|nr:MULTISPECIES: LacI family DNA-binding transcriptional regulator [unclassified Sphingomonas]KQM66653.1 LacI family transcriptional regulator [Sphingomonas sp. Leaf16]KQN17602.1 LacI family transcriptional regulator [Sphingomonas sp. Leaf29]KQN23466.1 LacI family transcriptional regulator [Sphingomonas sp. Leaf32]
MPRRRQAVTIKHVAADAGVSLQTVSRVINNEPNVRPEMAERVRGSISRLGYVPLIAAQRMGGSKSRLILSINDRDRTISGWQNREGTDWVDQMLLGGMLTCSRHGYRLILELVDTHSDHIERELLGAIGALRPDGVILTPPHSQDPVILDLLERQGISIARIGSRTPGPGFSLVMGDEGAARRATEHLIELGHRRIGFIAGASDYELSAWRVTGWRAAMAQAGLAADLLVPGSFDYASGWDAAGELLAAGDPPTAIIASSDQMAIATLDRARERGLAVPDDLSIISFDDTPIVRFATPPLTAITQPIAAVAALAVERIIAEQAQGDLPHDPVSVDAELTVRASTAPPPPERGRG